MKYAVMIIGDKPLISVSEKQANVQINKTLIRYLLKRKQWEKLLWCNSNGVTVNVQLTRRRFPQSIYDADSFDIGEAPFKRTVTVL